MLNRTFLILRFWKHQSCRTWRKCILSTSNLQKLSRHRESKWIHNPTWCAGSLKDSVIAYAGSHVLSVFLFNTSLHATQVWLINTRGYDEFKTIIEGAWENLALKVEKSADDSATFKINFTKKYLMWWFTKVNFIFFRTSITSKIKTVLLLKKSSKITKKVSSHKNIWALV